MNCIWMQNWYAILALLKALAFAPLLSAWLRRARKSDLWTPPDSSCQLCSSGPASSLQPQTKQNALEWQHPKPVTGTRPLSPQSQPSILLITPTLSKLISTTAQILKQMGKCSTHDHLHCCRWLPQWNLVIQGFAVQPAKSLRGTNFSFLFCLLEKKVSAIMYFILGP